MELLPKDFTKHQTPGKDRKAAAQASGDQQTGNSNGNVQMIKISSLQATRKSKRPLSGRGKLPDAHYRHYYCLNYCIGSTN